MAVSVSQYAVVGGMQLGTLTSNRLTDASRESVRFAR